MRLVPIYLEVKLDKSLKFCHHRLALSKKRRLPAVEVTWGLRAGAGDKTSDTALLFLVYSTAEYWSLVCSRSTWLTFSVLNDALRVVIECLHLSPTDHLTVFFKYPAI